VSDAGERPGAGPATGQATPAPGSDPRPQPLPWPDIDACCGQGCDPCVFDIVAAQRDRTRVELEAWLKRHPEAAAR
jgi:hypothetical protein